MTPWRGALVAGLAIVAGATVLAEHAPRLAPSSPLARVRAERPAAAQRFGGFLGNTAYDGRFVFVRMYYSPDLGLIGGGGGFGRGRDAWAHDYPTGERNFMRILTAVTNVSAHVEESSVLDFADPEMFKFPVIYLIEPGYWGPSEEQTKALREYLLKGGFMIVDDFPSWAWDNFAYQMSRVLPDGQWKDVDQAHPIFHHFFEIESLHVPTAYSLGGEPIFRAMYEDNDPARRMQVMVNYQNDISEFWEFSATGTYAVGETNEAYQFGVNEFMYAITH